MTEVTRAASGSSQDQRVCASGGRLVYYRRHMSPAFWDEHWRAAHRADFYLPYLEGYLGRGNLARVSDLALRLRWPAVGRLLAHLPRGATALRLLLDAAPYAWPRLARMRLYVARKKS
jgi:hypothetical protein